MLQNLKKYHRSVFQAPLSRCFSAGANLRSKYFITGQELEELIQQKPSNLRLINGSFHLPNEGIDPAAEHIKRRITPNAVFFNHDEICTPSPLPHTLPSLAIFSSHMRRLGIGRTSQIVCYDAHPLGMLGVARVAWMLRYFGATDVRILDGGLKKWIEEGRPLVEGPSKEEEPSSTTQSDQDWHVADDKKVILDIAEVHSLAGKLFHAISPQSLDFQIVDARGKARFDGTVKEPRPGLRSGHIKNSINLPFTELLNKDGTFKSQQEIAEIFKAHGISTEKPTLNTCGSGVTACVNELAQSLMGMKQLQVYDGSWTEYGGVDEPKW